MLLSLCRRADSAVPFGFEYTHRNPSMDVIFRNASMYIHVCTQIQMCRRTEPFGYCIEKLTTALLHKDSNINTPSYLLITNFTHTILCCKNEVSTECMESHAICSECK